MTTDIKVLKQLTAIRLEVNIWSARRKLTPAGLWLHGPATREVGFVGQQEDLRPGGTARFQHAQEPGRVPAGQGWCAVPGWLGRA